MIKRSSRTKRMAHSIIIAGILLLFVGLALSLSVHSMLLALVCGAGIALMVMYLGVLNLTPDGSRAQSTERTLEVASGMLKHLNNGLTKESAEIICALLLPETSAKAIAITNTEEVLGYNGVLPTNAVAGTQVYGPTVEVLESKRMETFASVDGKMKSQDALTGNTVSSASAVDAGVASAPLVQVSHAVDASGDAAPALPNYVFGIIVPLLVQDKTVGTIKLYYRSGLEIDRTQLAIARGFGELLSTQLSSHELDRQAELTARAEVKALQAQINPHFLFNTLNTIAALTRTQPTEARDLLREFSVFYRRTLENSEHQLIPLSQELEQTRRYLTIEKARFGQDRIVEREHIEFGCDMVLVPSFLVQPIVENAVRHAMRDVGPLHIDVHVATDGDDILIAVTDDGLGMSPEVSARLLDRATATVATAQDSGIALRNVTERIQRFYGVSSGIEILSKLDEGTSVTLRLGDAALQLRQDDEDDELWDDVEDELEVDRVGEG